MKNVVIYLRLEHASHRRRLLGIFRSLEQSTDWSLRIVSSEADLMRLMRDDPPPDGIIAYSVEAPESVRAVVESDIPFVGIGINSALRTRRRANVAFVKNDNEQIGREAAEYFLSRGLFRSYAYVATAADEDWCHVRGATFAARLAQAGHRCRRFVPQPDEKAFGLFLSALPKPAAVFTAWDGLAADVIRLARIQRIKVPDELSVLGVDNDELICEHTAPLLSSVNPDLEGAGDAAATALKRLIGRRRARPILVSCPILGIIERGSTAFVSPATALIERAYALIEQDAANRLTPNEIAHRLKVSRRLLDLRFRERERTTVADILAERRLAFAQCMLTKTKRPVKAVFEQAGFRSVAYATRLFKAKTGLTPRAWRISSLPTP